MSLSSRKSLLLTESPETVHIGAEGSQAVQINVQVEEGASHGFELKREEEVDPEDEAAKIIQLYGMRQPDVFRTVDLWRAVTKGTWKEINALACAQVQLSSGETVQRGLVERGVEGETILHAALLFQRNHDIIENILKQFPALITKTYLKQKYRGETALHMAVVQYDNSDTHIPAIGEDGRPYHKENPKSVLRLLVKKLSEMDKTVQERILTARVNGTEFHHFETGGLRHYGETILHFSVAAGHFNAAKLVLEALDQARPGLAKEALRYEDAISGYNVLHFMAKNKDLSKDEFVKMFFYLKELDPSLMQAQNKSVRKRMEIECNTEVDSKFPHKFQEKLKQMGTLANKRYTPLELAVREGNVNILEGIKEPLWEFDKTIRYLVPLNDLDPILYQISREALRNGKYSHQDLSPDDKSAIQMALERHDKDFINHPIIDTILKYKWSLYARDVFLLRFTCTFFLVALLITPAIAWQSKTFTERKSYSLDFSQNLYAAGLRLFFEIGSVTGVAIMLVLEAIELSRRKAKYYFTGYGSWENYVQLGLCGLVVAVVVVRGVVTDENVGLTLENLLLGGVAILGWIYLLSFAKGSEKLGPLVYIAWKVMSEDFLHWIVIYASVTLGFAGAMFLQMQSTVGYLPGAVSTVVSTSADNADPTQNWGNYIGAAIWVMRGVFQQGVWNDFSFARTPAIPQLLFVLYSFFVVILLINLLIGKVTQTLESIILDSEKEWRMQIASIIVGIDFHNLNRHKHLDVFGFHMADRMNGIKYFLFTASSGKSDVLQVKVGERSVLAEDGSKKPENIIKSAHELLHWSRNWSHFFFDMKKKYLTRVKK